MSATVDLNEAMSFVTVVREGTFTAAGKALGLPTSTVSRHVKRLEERLGIRLLNRTTRTMALTEVGEAYFDYCSRGIDVVQQAETIAAEVAGTPRGLLRVSVPNGFHRIWVALELADFIDEYPDVRLELQEAQRQVDLVAEGYDLALRGGRLPDANLTVQKIADSGLRFCAAPQYVAEHGEPTTLEELNEHPFFSFPLPGGGAFPFRRGDEVEMYRPTPRVAVSSWEVLADLTISGRGVSLLENSFAKQFIESGELVGVLNDYSFGPGGFYAIYPSSRLLSPKVRVFLDWVVERGRAYFS